MAERVVVVGYSTRALAEAASSAGWTCTSVDAFGDLDQKARVTNTGVVRDLGRRYSAQTVVAVARRLTGAAAYVGNLENHPIAVARLSRGRELLGNSAASLEAARDIAHLHRVVRQVGGRVPLTLFPGERLPRGRSFLRKPLRGGGGTGIRDLKPGVPLAKAELAQERIDGILGSMSFLADGRRARLLGVAEGLAGEAAFGAPAFRYCGNLFPLAIPDATLERLDAIAQASARAFGLRGLNGIDFVLRDGVAFVLELNPRHSSSMELLARAGLFTLFDLHAEACRGVLPASLPRLGPGVWGKAVLWARRPLVAPATHGWLARDDVRDVPHPGERIRRGHPVCTVLAHAADAAGCRASLAAGASAVEREFGHVPAACHA